MPPTITTMATEMMRAARRSSPSPLVLSHHVTQVMCMDANITVVPFDALKKARTPPAHRMCPRTLCGRLGNGHEQGAGGMVAGGAVAFAGTT